MPALLLLVDHGRIANAPLQPPLSCAQTCCRHNNELLLRHFRCPLSVRVHACYRPLRCPAVPRRLRLTPPVQAGLCVAHTASLAGNDSTLFARLSSSASVPERVRDRGARPNDRRGERRSSLHGDRVRDLRPASAAEPAGGGNGGGPAAPRAVSAAASAAPRAAVAARDPAPEPERTATGIAAATFRAADARLHRREIGQLL